LRASVGLAALAFRVKPASALRTYARNWHRFACAHIDGREGLVIRGLGLNAVQGCIDLESAVTFSITTVVKEKLSPPSACFYSNPELDFG
jgi:hypothetical protein